MKYTMLAIIAVAIILLGQCPNIKCVEYEQVLPCKVIRAFIKLSDGLTQLMEFGSYLQDAIVFQISNLPVSDPQDETESQNLNSTASNSSTLRKKRFIGNLKNSFSNTPSPQPSNSTEPTVQNHIENTWKSIDVEGNLFYLGSRVNLHDMIMNSLRHLDFNSMISSKINGDALTNELVKIVNIDNITTELVKKIDINKIFEKPVSDVDFQQIINDAVQKSDLNNVTESIIKQIDLEKSLTDLIKTTDLRKIISTWINTIDIDALFKTTIDSVDPTILSEKIFSFVKKYFNEEAMVQVLLDVFVVKNENVTTLEQLTEFIIQQMIPAFDLQQFVNELKQAADDVFKPVAKFFRTLEISLVKGVNNKLVGVVMPVVTKLVEKNPDSLKELFNIMSQEMMKGILPFQAQSRSSFRENLTTEATRLGLVTENLQYEADSLTNGTTTIDISTSSNEPIHKRYRRVASKLNIKEYPAYKTIKIILMTVNWVLNSVAADFSC